MAAAVAAAAAAAHLSNADSRQRPPPTGKSIFCLVDKTQSVGAATVITRCCANRSGKLRRNQLAAVGAIILAATNLAESELRDVSGAELEHELSEREESARAPRDESDFLCVGALDRLVSIDPQIERPLLCARDRLAELRAISRKRATSPRTIRRATGWPPHASQRERASGKTRSISIMRRPPAGQIQFGQIRFLRREPPGRVLRRLQMTCETQAIQLPPPPTIESAGQLSEGDAPNC